MQIFTNELVEYYKGREDYDKLFRYVFKVYTLAFTLGPPTDEFESGVMQTPKLEIDNNGVVDRFLKRGFLLLRYPYCPSVLSLLLKHWRVEEQSHYTITVEQTHMLALAEELIKGYHSSWLAVLLDTECLWSKEIQEYANTQFFPSLPQNIKNECKLDD